MHTVLSIPRPALHTPGAQAQLPNSVLNIGLTGGIGSGKSTVSRLLRERGVAVIDLDGISHELTQANGRAMPEIVAQFGADAMQADGALNRAWMRARVFENPELRKKLEAITHPLIAQVTVERAHEWVSAGVQGCVVYDIPLLAEGTFWHEQLDWVVVVETERVTQIERVQARSPQLSVTDIEQIIDAQASPDERRNIANVLINNEKNQTNLLNLGLQIDILVRHIGMLAGQQI